MFLFPFRRLRALATAAALAAALTLAPAMPATADTPEERRAIADAYVEASLEDMDVGRMVRSMWQPLVDQLAAAGTPLRPDQIERIDALYQASMGDELIAIMRSQVDTMVELFTLEELTALYEFYTSPLGRRVMSRLPEVLERQQPQILAMAERTMPVLIPQVIAIVEGR